MNRRLFFSKAALFVAGCQLALKCEARPYYYKMQWSGEAPKLTTEHVRNAVKLLNEDDGKYYNLQLYSSGTHILFVEAT